MSPSRSSNDPPPAFAQAGAAREVLAAPRLEVVDDAHGVPFGQDRLDQVRADEASAAGHHEQRHHDLPTQV